MNPPPPMCKCELPAVMRTVNKEGGNKGKKFFVCGKPRGEQCEYFKWKLEHDNPGMSNSNGSPVKRARMDSPSMGRDSPSSYSNWKGSAAVSSPRKIITV